MKENRWAGTLQKYLPSALADFLPAQRWFAGKAQAIRSVSVTDVIPAGSEGLAAYLVMVRVSYSSGQDHHYALALVVSPRESEDKTKGSGGSRIALEAEGEEPSCTAHDALHEPAFARLLMERIRRGDTLGAAHSKIVAAPCCALPSLWDSSQNLAEPSVMKGEQSNTSIRYGEQFILKFYRRIEEGVNLDFEMGSFLTEKARFKYTAPLAGSIDYHRAGRPSATLAILQGYVPNQGDAWQYTLEAISRFLDGAASRQASESREATQSFAARLTVSQLLDHESPIPSWAEPSLRAYLQASQLLGKRTAELHLALISNPDDPAFAPEGFSPDYRRSISDSMIRIADENLSLLTGRLNTLSPSTLKRAQQVLAHREQIHSRFRDLKETEISTMRTRLHGDYHLGQVLVAGADFAIIDFEGEPERPLAERRIKRSPLRDVAGMLRSFHYAAETALRRRQPEPKDKSGADLWSVVWTNWTSAAFLQAYCRQATGACFLPESRGDLAKLLSVFMLEKAIYELGYELKNRPGWAEIPLSGILDLL
jgi:trehalose synthase-fused probable maltokinase